MKHFFSNSLRNDAPKSAGVVRVDSWFIVLCLVAAAPFVFTILTWDSDGRTTGSAFAIRLYSLPVVLLELGILWIAARQGFTIQAAYSRLAGPIKWALSIWSISALVSAAFTNIHFVVSVFITLRYLLQGLVLAAVIYLVSQVRSSETSRWLLVLTAGSLAYLLALILFIALIADVQSFPWFLGLPSGTHVRQIGNNLSLLAIAPIAGLLARDVAHKLLFFVAVTVSIAFVAWTGTRGGLMALALGSVAGMAMALRFTTMRNLALFCLAFSAGIFLSTLFFKPDPDFGLLRMVGSVTSGENMSSGRTTLWANTMTEIAKQPFFGFGSGSFRQNMVEIYDYVLNHPHNVILQFIYDWGVVGGVAALVMLASLGLYLLKSDNRNSTIRFLSIAGFGSTMLIAMIDGALFNPLQILVAIALVSPAFFQSDQNSA